jgi:hypothetical protein
VNEACHRAHFSTLPRFLFIFCVLCYVLFVLRFFCVCFVVCFSIALTRSSVNAGDSLRAQSDNQPSQNFLLRHLMRCRRVVFPNLAKVMVAVTDCFSVRSLFSCFACFLFCGFFLIHWFILHLSSEKEQRHTHTTHFGVKLWSGACTTHFGVELWNGACTTHFGVELWNGAVQATPL